MKLTQRITCSLLFAVLLPTAVFAQKYEADKYTKEADKYVGLAMTKGDLAARQEMYRKALEALLPAMASSTDNGRVWFTAGVAYVGLERYASADSAFHMATTLYPLAAADADAERAVGWLQAFTAGAALMDKNENEAALAMLESAEQLYPEKRPEGVLNMAGLYLARGENDKAEAAYKAAIKAATGDLYATQDTAVQRTWRNYVQLGNLNLAQARATRGNAAFDAKDFDAAAKAYKEARMINPHSRDYAMNYVQARYAKIIELEDAIAADTTKLATFKAQLLPIYDEVLVEIPKVRAFDPTNVNMLLIQSEIVRNRGQLTGNGMAARKEAFAIAQKADSMAVELTGLSVQGSEAGVSVSGNVKNNKLAAGSNVVVNITLIGADGASIGKVSATVAVGAKDTAVAFSKVVTTDEYVAGWRYEVVTP